MIEEIIRAEIKANGHITLGRFMELSLYHPQYGYYMTRDPFGKAGDFTTAPEISQMFGELIGAWVANIWQQMGGPATFNLIELGPGRGTLMSDMTHATSRVHGFANSVQKWFMECSPFLRKIQEKNCSGIDIRWVETLSELDNDNPCIIVGNEFLDALPMEQFIRKNGQYTQRVMIDNGEVLAYNEIAVPDERIPAYYRELGAFTEQFEFSAAQEQFMETCCQKLKRTGGAVLLIDYGYTEESVKVDTLQAVKGHKFSGILSEIGNTDLTAHVNFRWLEHAAKKNGMDWHGVENQGTFLRNLGLVERAEILKKAATGQKNMQQIISGLNSAVERLAGRRGMGHLFKAACFSSGYDLKPAGFVTSAGI